MATDNTIKLYDNICWNAFVSILFCFMSVNGAIFQAILQKQTSLLTLFVCRCYTFMWSDVFYFQIIHNFHLLNIIYGVQSIFRWANNQIIVSFLAVCIFLGVKYFKILWKEDTLFVPSVVLPRECFLMTYQNVCCFAHATLSLSFFEINKILQMRCIVIEILRSITH